MININVVGRMRTLNKSMTFTCLQRQKRRAFNPMDG